MTDRRYTNGDANVWYALERLLGVSFSMTGVADLRTATGVGAPDLSRGFLELAGDEDVALAGVEAASDLDLLFVVVGDGLLVDPAGGI
jgi:hypothetical protein